MTQPPTKEQIKAGRLAARLTQQEAAAVVYMSYRGWQNWELGGKVNLGLWELFLHKTGQVKIKFPSKIG